MFTRILWTQFKWTRTLLAASMVITFAAPSLAWRIGASVSFGTAPSALEMMTGFQPVGMILMVTACLLGFLLVAIPWGSDAAAKHVYALSLPIPWRRYVGMRFGAGALTLLLPAASLWLGALVTLALVEIPAMLHAYPGGLAVRFALATLLVYGMTFLLQYLAGRRAPILLLTILLTGVAVVVIATAAGYGAALNAIGRALTEWPGPLAIFSNEWKLLDV